MGLIDAFKRKTEMKDADMLMASNSEPSPVNAKTSAFSGI